MTRNEKDPDEMSMSKSMTPDVMPTCRRAILHSVSSVD